MRNMGKNRLNIFYSEKKWYINNYNALGADWLLESIRKLNPKKRFVFASLSANAAYYENDVYQALKDEYNPFFYVGDIFAENLADAKIESYGNFKYLSGQRDACDVEECMLDNHKIDILLDCKGALWYATRLKYIEDAAKAIQLLKKYKELLKPEGVLLIDYYDQRFFDTIVFELLGGNRKKKKIKCIGEESTKTHLQKIFGRDFVKQRCIELVKSNIKSGKLPLRIGTAVLNISAIEEMIKILEDDKSVQKIFKRKRAMHHFFKIMWWIVIPIVMFIFIRRMFLI